MTARILVVDDEKDLVNLVRYNLQKEGFLVDCAYNGSSVPTQVENHLPDLIILDLMLPDRSGYDICRDFKANPETSHIPIIMLTARSSEYNRVIGFECGVEDYVIKPFSPKELTLRVKAILSRIQSENALSLKNTSEKALEQKRHFGVLTIDLQNRRVFVASKEVLLTQMEYKLLLFLIEQPYRVKDRQELLTVWDEAAASIRIRTVDTHIKRLRAKLGEQYDLIQTLRGRGYRIKPQTPEEEQEALDLDAESLITTVT